MLHMIHVTNSFKACVVNLHFGKILAGMPVLPVHKLHRKE